MILLSLASKQIWPQVLSVVHLKPQRIFLLHSDDVVESRGPAQRLKRFFDESGLVPRGGTRMESISDTDFDAVERRLDELQTSHRLPLSECIMNFTGGNKLMATAAFRWAAKRGARAFYLERRNQLSWFIPRDGELLTCTEGLDGSCTNRLDPVQLLRCQLDASEIARPGQTLILSDRAQEQTEKDFFLGIRNGIDVRRWLRMTGEPDREAKEGDSLEFATAAVLLKFGVHSVQRGLCLKVKSAPRVGTRRVHAEIDLLFTWNGRLWVVDCKDKRPVENLAEALRRTVPRLSPKADQLLNRIREELAISQTKALKEDLLAVREVGGLLGNVICVRKSELPEEVAQYAHNNGIALVRKNELVDGLRTLLRPDRPADQGDLAALAEHFRK